VAKHQADLRRYILDVKPNIILFCGHGTQQGLMLEDDIGTPKVVKNKVITDLLQNFTDRIECVVLNACDTKLLTEALAQHLNYATGMNQPVYDDAALAYAEGFYDALGAGESHETAFEIGKNAAMSKASSRSETSRKAIVIDEAGESSQLQNLEHLIPVLEKNLNPISIHLTWLSPEAEQEGVSRLLEAILEIIKEADHATSKVGLHYNFSSLLNPFVLVYFS
jgi:hypothetical protein